MTRQPTVVTAAGAEPTSNLLWVIALLLPFAGTGLVFYNGFRIDRATDLLALLPFAMSVLIPVNLILLTRGQRRRRPLGGRVRLEVTDERVFLSAGTGVGREWRKTDGDLVHLTGRGGRTAMTIGFAHDTPVPLRSFDLPEIRAAFLSHGWALRDGDGPVLEPPPVPPDRAEPEPELELVLKAPKGSFDVRMWLTVVRIFGVGVCVLILGPGIWLSVSRNVHITVPLLAVLLIVTVPTTVFVAIRGERTAGLFVTISRDRLSVRRGDNAQVLNRGQLSGPGLVGRHEVRFTAANPHWQVLSVPASIRREEVLAQLSAHGWPLEGDMP